LSKIFPENRFPSRIKSGTRFFGIMLAAVRDGLMLRAFRTRGLLGPQDQQQLPEIRQAGAQTGRSGRWFCPVRRDRA
jgi:hypothetical protein